MQAHYPMAIAAAGGATTSQRRSGKLLDFSQVGPVGLLPLLEECDSKQFPPSSSFIDSRPRAQGTAGR
jgi:hypothetical protein